MAQASAQDCINDVVAKCKEVGLFGTADKEKIFNVYSEDDLFDKSKFVKMPALGIMYEGTRDSGKDSTGLGQAAILTVAIVLMLDGKSVGGINSEHEGVKLLTLIRKEFRKNNGVAPTGHRWKFDSEIPAGNVGNLLIYVQRWKTTILLT